MILHIYNNAFIALVALLLWKLWYYVYLYSFLFSETEMNFSQDLTSMRTQMFL